MKPMIPPDEETYTAHFPFKWLYVPEKHDVSFGTTEGNWTSRVVSDEKGEAYIEVTGLPDEQAARNVILRCWFGLLAYSAMHHRPHEVEAGIGEITWMDDVFLSDGPEKGNRVDGDLIRGVYRKTLGLDMREFDGFVTGRLPRFYPSGKRVKAHRMVFEFQPKQSSGEEVAENLTRSILDNRFFEHVNDKKMIAALELCNLARTNMPKLAAFILIVSALEALMPVASVSPEALEQIAIWEEEAKSKGIEELSSLKSLHYPSIGKRFLRLANDYPPENVKTKKERRKYDEQMRITYELRSNLVHQGWCDEEEMSRLYPMVAELLGRVLADRLKWKGTRAS